MTALNGWTADKLYELQDKVNETHRKTVFIEEDVAAIKQTLQKMQSEETTSLRQQVRELQQRPRIHMQAVIVPFLCACIPAIVILVTHGN